VYRARFYPLGHPVDFESDSEAALEVVRSAWSAWPCLFGRDPYHVVIQTNDGPPAAAPPVYSPSPNRLRFLCDDQNYAAVSTQCAILRVSLATVENREFFRYHFVEAVVLTAIDATFTEPIHGACVAKNGKGVLLCGDSGAGKTTLAYACARAGWTLISEDGLHFSPGGILVGGFWVFRLREPARDLFPEIRECEASLAPNGKLAIALDARAAGMSVDWSCRPGAVVFLARRPGAPELVSYDESRAMEFFSVWIRNHDRDTSTSRFRKLIRSGCYELRYERVQEAVDVLDTL
jgi:hypothetical protein